MRFVLILAVPAFLVACDTSLINASSDANSDVRVDYAFGRQLRDRCLTTNDFADCQTLREYDEGLGIWKSNWPF